MDTLKSLWHTITEGIAPKGGHEGSSKVAKNQAVYRRFYNQAEGDFYLGRTYSKDRLATLGMAFKVGHKGNRHLMLIGGTRAGKGRRVLMHNILNHPGNTLVHDPKGESAIICAHALEQRGYRVVLLDPFDQCEAVVKDGSMRRFKAGYNPLFDVNPYHPSGGIMLQALSTIFIQDRGKADASMQYWVDTQRNVCQGLTAWASVVFSDEQKEVLRSTPPDQIKPEQMQYISMYNNIHLAAGFNEMPDDFLAARVEEMCDYNGDYEDLYGNPVDQTQNYVGDLIRNGGRMAEKYLDRTGDQQGFRSLLTTFGNQFMWAKNAQMKESLLGSDFRFQMTQLKTEEKIVAFVVIPKAYMRVVSPWIRMLFCMGMNAVELNPGKPKHPINFIIDEAPRLGNIPEIEDAFAMGAGQGARVIYVCQDLGQVKKDYGESWETLIGNSDQMLLSVSDNFTTEYFSRKADKTFKIDEKTKKKGENKVEVLTLGEIAKITHPERKTGLYFEGGANPLRVSLRNYDEEFRAGRGYRVHPDHAKRRHRLPKAGYGQALAIESKNEGVVMLEDRRREQRKPRHVQPSKKRRAVG